MAGSNVVIPYGVPFESLYVLFLLEKKFFDFIFCTRNRPFLTPENLYPPWRDHLVIPYGVPFESLSVLFLSLEKVF